MNPRKRKDVEEDETKKEYRTPWEEEKARMLANVKEDENEQGLDRPAKEISEKKKMVNSCLKKPKMIQPKMIQPKMIQPKMIQPKMK